MCGLLLTMVALMGVLHWTCVSVVPSNWWCDDWRRTTFFWEEWVTIMLWLSIKT